MTQPDGQFPLPLDRPGSWTDYADAFESAVSPRLPLDEWAPRHRVVIGGPRPGPWRNSNAPQALEPMQAVSQRHVDQVTIVSPAQLLKSEFAINVAVWGSHYGSDVLFYEPDLPLLKEFFGDKIRPAMHSIGEDVVIEGVDSRLLKKRDSAIVLRLPGGAKILGLSPEMKTGKSSHSAPIVVIDEIDKMLDPTMITTARSRSTVYEGDAVIVVVSTPSEDLPGSSWRIWSSGSRGVWHGRCPRCDELVSVGWGNVNFERDEDGFWLPRWGDKPSECAALVCGSCEARWSEAERQQAIRAGEYIHADPDCSHRSFHIPGPAHLWRTVEHIVAVGADAYRGAILDGSWADYQLFVNEWQAEPWTSEAMGLSARGMQRSVYVSGGRGENDLGELDPRALLITAGSDVGEHAIYTEFVAWGIDVPSRKVLAWGLRYAVTGGTPDISIEDPDLWRAWDRLISESAWRHPSYPGIQFRPWRVLIDSGYRSELVRSWCEAKFAEQIREQGLKHVQPYGARVLPLKSRSREIGGHPVDLSSGLRNPSSRVRAQLPALVAIESNQIKDAIYEGVLRDGRLPEGATRANYWPADRNAHGYTDHWFAEFSNEVKTFHRSPSGVVSSRWEVKKGIAKANEAWDCRVYATAAALVEVWPQPLLLGMLKLAIREATREGATATDQEKSALRRAVLEYEGEPSADNIVPLK